MKILLFIYLEESSFSYLCMQIYPSVFLRENDRIQVSTVYNDRIFLFGRTAPLTLQSSQNGYVEGHATLCEWRAYFNFHVSMCFGWWEGRHPESLFSLRLNSADDVCSGENLSETHYGFFSQFSSSAQGKLIQASDNLICTDHIIYTCSQLLAFPALIFFFSFSIHPSIHPSLKCRIWLIKIYFYLSNFVSWSLIKKYLSFE